MVRSEYRPELQCRALRVTDPTEAEFTKVVAAVTRKLNRMGDKSDISIDKFCGSSYQEWENWFDDFKVFAELKKWSAEKKVSFIRFFVTGNVKEALRQTTCQTLEDVDAAAKKVLGGAPDQLSAARTVDAEVYRGDIQDYLLRVRAGVRHAYPELGDEARSSITLLYLQRALPVEYSREITKEGCTTLEGAIRIVEAQERADQLFGPVVANVCRLPKPADDNGGRENAQLEEDRSPCFVCGQPGHWRRQCLFREDVCGRCGRRGHLGVVCRGSGNGGRSSSGRGARWTGGAGQPRQ